MPRTIHTIRSMFHFEPLSELALQRYAINSDGSVDFKGGDNGELEVDFILELMELYTGLDNFQAERFSQYSISTILEYLERTHAFYESTLLPKIEQSIIGIKKLFPDHPISGVLESFFQSYRKELLSHIDMEETKLFPYARRLAHGGGARDFSVADFHDMHSHEVEDSLDKIINEIETNHPEVARSFAYRAFHTILQQFRLDLEIHHHIEEKVFIEMLTLLEEEQDSLPFQ
ncbi:hypothetical protein N8004_00615 [Salibacteraceae bacterium]|nr:hypothetical protein [Flavobacteriales bacterium]MDB9701479.1 hypothetical protein [Salibacteraceae bacterium]MDC1202460.1 hypothetical protein [Salibacteraceae bacterium]